LRDFRLTPRDVAENCALLVYCAASSGNFFTDVSGQPIGTILRFLDFGFFNPENETDRLPWNVAKKLPLLAA